MDELYLSDLDTGMVSWRTLVMMTKAFGLDALHLAKANTINGAV